MMRNGWHLRPTTVMQGVQAAKYRFTAVQIARAKISLPIQLEPRDAYRPQTIRLERKNKR
jgi:hypothetical protein